MIVHANTLDQLNPTYTPGVDNSLINYHLYTYRYARLNRCQTVHDNFIIPSSYTLKTLPCCCRHCWSCLCCVLWTWVHDGDQTVDASSPSDQYHLYVYVYVAYGIGWCIHSTCIMCVFCNSSNNEIIRRRRGERIVFLPPPLSLSLFLSVWRQTTSCYSIT